MLKSCSWLVSAAPKCPKNQLLWDEDTKLRLDLRLQSEHVWVLNFWCGTISEKYKDLRTCILTCNLLVKSCDLTCDLFWQDLKLYLDFPKTPRKRSTNHCKLKTGFKDWIIKYFVWSLCSSFGLLTLRLPHLEGVWMSRVTQHIIQWMKHHHEHPSLVKSNPRCHSTSGPTQSGFHGNSVL